MDKAYVREYSRLEKEHWWFRVREKIIIYFLKKHLTGASQSPDPKVLNIGAAAGATSRLLTAFGAVTSVETDLYFIEHLKEQHLDVEEASVTSLPFPENSFDLVCAFDVLEHVEQDSIALNEMSRVCRSGGLICITVPAFKFLWSQHDEVNHHYRRYSRKEITNLFADQPNLNFPEINFFNFLLFIPILLARKIASLTGSDKRNLKSDFTRFKTRGISGRLLKKIFEFELFLLRWLQLPFGVSMIVISRKIKK